MTAPARETFETWFNRRFLDPDGGDAHLPDWLKDDLSSAWDAALSSAGLPAPAPHAEQQAMLANAIRSGELELVFCHPTGKFPALSASQEQRNIVEASLRSPAPHAEVREALEPFAKIAPFIEFTDFRDGEVVHRQYDRTGARVELTKEDFRRAAKALALPQSTERGGK